MSYKIGSVSSARIANDAITAAKIAAGAVGSSEIADDAITSSEIADDAILTAAISTDAVISDGIQANAVTSSELADNAVDSGAVVDSAIIASKLAVDSVETLKIKDAAVTSAKLASAISITDLTVTGDLSVIGNTSSITLEEVQVDQAKIVLNREDTTNFSSLQGNIGVVVKGGADSDVKMLFDKPAGSDGRAIFVTEDSNGTTSFMGIKAANVEGSTVTCTGNAEFGTGSEKMTFFAGSGLLTSQGGFSGSLTGNVTGNASTASKLATARTIGGVSFDGSANVSLPGVDAQGNQDTTGNAATATALASSRTFALTGDITGSATFDGTGNCSIATTIGADSLVLGTATTGNYVATVAAASGIAGLSVSGSGSETAAVELSLHGSLEAQADAFIAADYTNSKEYVSLHTGQTAASALQVGPSGKTLLAANTSANVRDAAGLGSGYTAQHGDLKTASQRLIESVSTVRPGHASFSNAAGGNDYKAFYNLHAESAESSVAFALPLIDNTDDSGNKMKLGQKMVLKLGALGSGGSVQLTLPSGANASTKIDGANTFDLDEVNQAVTICALNDANGVAQYFII